ncbi:MAG TPA: Ig-like domain-containing protein, partial [Thermoanaerobaculia bacterium]|nr:Ig-like domain-containing protein [Thermoanaerobaculia bacterium]
SQFRPTTSAADGTYQVTDLPVGPLTFSAQDAAGNIAYAANELHAGGELVVQDISIYKAPFPGVGTVYGRIVRSDTNQPVAGARVAVYSQGYGFTDIVTDTTGTFNFTKVPAGFVTVLAANFGISPTSVAVDFDLKANETRNMGDLVLVIPAPNTVMVSVEGDVTAEDPLNAGVFHPVPNAQVQIKGFPGIVANASGHYRYDSIPQTASGQPIGAYDPVSRRSVTKGLPDLAAPTQQTPTNIVPLTITNTADKSIKGTVRVHLLSASGTPVDGYHVFEVLGGGLTLDAAGMGNGVYEFQNLSVGESVSIVAAPFSLVDPVYGYQVTTGSGAIQFAGQIAAVTLHLPGQGTVTANIQQQTQSGVFVKLAGNLDATFLAWDNTTQEMRPRTIHSSTDGTNDAVFQKMPGKQAGGNQGDVLIETVDSAGYAAVNATVGYDGAIVQKTLILTTLAEVRGHVFAPDGYTPVAGATVHMIDGAQDLGTAVTGVDGSFDYKNIVPNSTFSVTADYTINGIYRTGIATGSTPSKGGVVDNVAIILEQQGSVEGTVVDANNNPVPFAKIWLRELSFPSRNLGTATDPRFTDGFGHFRFNNIFAVGVRISAEDPTNPESRGDWNGTVLKENDVQHANIVLSATGLGSVRITVLDPNNALAPVPNAEVSLYRGGLFDFGTTDASGSIQFDQLPVDNYTAGAFSKTQFKSGASNTFSVAKNLTTNVSITLDFSGEVNGSLTDPQNSNAVVPGANVTLSGQIGLQGYTTRATTGVDGSFDFKGVREGNFQIEARDPNTVRMAWGQGIISSVYPTATVPLTLQPTSTLTVKAFLPNDSGASSGVLASLVNIDVSQFSQGGPYLRSSQTNGAQFPGLIRTDRNGNPVGINVVVKELGGLNRVANGTVKFDANTAAKEVDFVFVASGTVNVTVQSGNPPAPAANVQVTAGSGGVTRNGYTDANGFVSLSGVPLGTVGISAVTQGSSPLTGSATVQLNSQTTPATATILLGSYDSVTGKVLAEGTTQPSVGTRVILQYNNQQFEARTDATGSYSFLGIATPLGGLTVHFIYLGPDDATIGAQQNVVLQTGAGLVHAPDVTLDSTPPRLLGIFPADAATKVAPDTQLKFTFNRAIRNDQMTTGYFHLYDVAAGAELQMTFATAVLQPDNSQVITFNPPAKPANQTFPLKSNTLYRIQISGALQDLANHVLGADLGSSFTTSDYSAPTVTKVDPSPKQPLTKNGVRIGITFSKPLDPAPWQSGGSGSMTMIQISAIGGQPIGSALPGTVQLDPVTNGTVYFGPNVTLSPASFYRVSISGVVDTDGRGMVDANGQPLAVFTQDFFTFDNVAPVVTINNPKINGVAIGDNDPLYLSVLYTIPVTLLNPDGSAVTDLDRVDFYSVAADGTLTTITRNSPTSVAIAAPPGATSFTVRADAWDLSLNKGTATRTWSVAAQPALTINSTVITPATVYPSGTVTDTVQIGGGGLDANVTVTATLQGSTNTLVSATTPLSRHLFTDPWPSAPLSMTIPRSVAGGAQVVLTTTVTDIRGFSATPKADTITLASDAAAPVSQPVTIEYVKHTVTDALTFNNKDQYRVHGFASDAETGVASMTFTIDGTPYPINAGASGSTYHSNTGVWEFVSPTITVQSHNNDYTVAISAKASDYAGNSSSANAAVTYLGIHDPNAPTVAWIAPLHDAAWPAATNNFSAKLRVFASSPLPLVGTFDVPGAGTLTATRNGNVLEATLSNFTTPAAGTDFQIVAHVNDGDGGHVIDLPINVDLVTALTTIPSGGTIAVDATHPAPSDSIVVDGGRLIFYVPTTLKNLIVIDGGVVDTVPSTTAADHQIDLTITDHLYVDDTSSIDVSRRGYLGGLEANADNSGSNTSHDGMTAGRTTTGGATGGASASFAGIGGDDAGATNAAYGSITAPADLGSGGSADSSNRPGGQGGGAAYIHVASGGLGKVVVAGNLLADGQSGVNIGGAGSGGSIHINANQIVLGATSKVSANGGDDDGSTTVSRAGGGGRISLEASQLLDVDSSNGTHIFALGGHNNANDTASALDGGAGTIFLRNAGETNGELLITSYDSRFPSTVHLTRATPLAGTLNFDKVTIGPRALARADASVTIAGVADDKTKATIDASGMLLLQGDVPTLTVSTNPAAGSNLIQGTSLGLTYTAASPAGVGSVTYTLAPAAAAHSDTFPYTPAPAQQTPSIVVPGTAPAGTATLTVHVLDRAGRTADAVPSTFTIVANQAPVITDFTLTAANPLYIGGSITAAVSATDDVQIKTLSLTSQIGANGTPSTQNFTTNSTPASHTFTVAIARDATLDGQTVTLTAKADDGTATPTTSVKTLTIAHDANPPVISISEPNANTPPYSVGDNKLIHVVATIIDAESGVNTSTITASIPGSPSKTMTPTANANEYAADLAIPFEPGTDTVTVNVTVTASDILNNNRSQTAPVRITPKYDPTAPVVTWLCGASGAIVPPGATIPLTVKAVPGSSGTAIVHVTFNDGTTTFTASQNGNTYSYNYVVPANTPDGTVINFLASALTNGQGTGTQQAEVTVVVVDKTISTNTTIQSSDLSYDFQNVAITGGTTTLIGHHEFKKLIILGGATLTQTPTTSTNTFSVDFKATSVYVACGGLIDVSGRGYPGGVSYPGVAASTGNSGGSHIGLSFGSSGSAGAAYGSVEQPQEPGAGAGCCIAGGGVVRVNTTSLAVDGVIRANGANVAGNQNSAGGSIWITTGTLDGTGTVETKGWCCGYAPGGGGAISINYTTLQSGATVLNTATAAGGATNAGAGSIYIKGPSSTYGSLTVDNKGITGGITQLPSMGGGVAQSGSSGATLVTDSPSNVLGFFVGHWVEVRDPSGTLKGSWRIATINAKTVTLAPNGNETINVAAGDLWQGVYQFDTLSDPSGDTIKSNDPIRIGVNGVVNLTGPTTAGKYLEILYPISGTTVTVSGNVSVPSVTAQTLTVSSGATLTVPATTTPTTLAINVSGTVTVQAGGLIDVSGRGYPGGVSYPGVAASTGNSGGSHIGLSFGSSGSAGAAYGNVEQPQEPGAGAGCCVAGGGVIRINAGTLIDNGAIRADGANVAGNQNSAGGSIWITAGTLDGTGAVQARGWCCGYAPGGGGAISINYTTLQNGATVLNNAVTSGNTNSGAGSIYVKGPSSTYGSLTVDNKGFTGGITQLPSMGGGVAQSGSSGATLVTDSPSNVLGFFVGHWVEIADGTTGAVKGDWRIATINAKTVTLAPNGNETINVAAGDLWRGIYRFDSVTLNGITLNTLDRIDSTNAIVKQGGATIVGNNLAPPAVDLSKISIANGVVGPSLIGTAGAVSDPDTPITVIAQNRTKSLTVSAAAASDGSFSIPLSGSSGDSIYVSAKDSNVYPMQSLPQLVGQLTTGNSTATATVFTSQMTANDAAFRARRLASDGAYAVAGSGNSNKLAVFDVTTGSPIWAQTFASNSVINDAVVRNGVAYVVNSNYRLEAIDLTVNPAVSNVAGNFDCGTGYSLAVDGGYAFVGDCQGDGRIDIFDLSNPKVPVKLRAQGTLSTANVSYTQLLPYGSYLIGISPNQYNGGHDVVVINRRDVNSLFVVANLDIPNFSGTRASIVGSTLYVIGSEGSLAVVDLGTPSAPAIRSVTAAAPTTHGVAAVSSSVFVAGDSGGLSAFNVVNPAAPVLAGNVSTSPQLAWDVVVRGTTGFIAADDRLLSFATGVPPQVDPTKFTLSFDGQNVTVTAAGQAILGQAPLTVTVHDQTKATSVSGIAVASNGSFTTTMAASGGDVLDVVASDASSRTSSVTIIGNVPFSSSSSLTTLPATTTGDSSFRARRLALDGTWMTVQNFPATGFESNRLAVLDMTSGTPVYKQTITLSGSARDVTMRNGVAYSTDTNYRINVVDMTVSPATATTAGNFLCSNGWSVLVDGTYAFVGDCQGDGRIDMFDLTNPKAPVKLRDQGTLSTANVSYTQLLAYGNYLVGITPNSYNGGHDVVVLDRRDINNLATVANFDIPNFAGVRGALSGSTLYEVSQGGQLSIVDLTNPASPVVKSTINTPGTANSIVISGTTAIIADGSAGVSFYDVSSPTAPKLLGTQPVGGTAWDVKIWGNKLYVANEQGVVTLTGLVAPPVVNTGLVSITRTSSGATVTGAAGAVNGTAPLTLTIHDETNSGVANVTGVVVSADGSFTATIAAGSGDVLDVTATDGGGRNSSVTVVGSVPFSTSFSLTALPAATTTGDSSFRARRLALDGTWMT